MIDAASPAALATPPADLVDPSERRLGPLTLVLGLLVWALIVVGSFGVVLIWVALAGLGYLFAQSGLVAYLRGAGARLGPQQFPALYAQFQDCCRQLGIREEPEAYVLQGGGWMNAFAARFLGRHFVVLLSDVVDAMDEHPDGVRFYIGHELGHIRRGHLTGGLWRLPVLWLPLLGAAYARAQERSCDLHGRACSSSSANAARALGALVVGGKRWATLNLDGLAAQLPATRGFWMSYHELIGAYPWLTKRIARLEGRELPGRHPLAWLLAMFTPYGGRAGGGAAGALVAVALIGVLAAVALPAYKDYTAKAQLTQTLAQAQTVQTALGRYYLENGEVPESLEQIGQSTQLGTQGTLSLNPENMVLTLSQGEVALELIPRKSGDAIVWRCQAAEGTRLAAVPASCR